MGESKEHHIELGGRRIAYRIVRSLRAKKLWLRVGPNGLQVTQPARRTARDVTAFLAANGFWILKQLQRLERLHNTHVTPQQRPGVILFRGEPTQVRIQGGPAQARQNAVSLIDGEISVCCAGLSKTRAGQSLENWLRKQARLEIERHLASLNGAVRQKPGAIHIRDQRTRWGSCSSRKNLSFNWRLIMAPDFVLRYLVIHEAVHLDVPNHSAQFWSNVRALCPDTDQARHWLRAHHSEMMVDLDSALGA